jgi:hypothetical protein
VDSLLCMLFQITRYQLPKPKKEKMKLKTLILYSLLPCTHALPIEKRDEAIALDRKKSPVQLSSC